MGTSTTTVAISGGGPAGVTLGLLLARAGVEVVVLEKHASFRNDFRGDTIHPSTLRVLEDLGLAEEIEQLPQRKLRTLTIGSEREGTITIRLDQMSGNYPYISMIPQVDFLNMLVRQAANYPNFRILMEARSTGLLYHGESVCGLTYSDRSGDHEIHSTLTVSADGRHSDLRRVAGLVPTELGSPMDVLWLRVTRDPDAVSGLHGRTGAGTMAFAIDRGSYWQIAYVIRKGGFERLLAEPIGALRGRLVELLPILGGHIAELDDWSKVAFLSVSLNRLKRWYLPGYLCIGDAAHAMTPVGGVGVNLAVQDAVATANNLAEPLYRAQIDRTRPGRSIHPKLLTRVQRRRWFPDAGTQAVQKVIQRQLFGSVLSAPDESTHRGASEESGSGSALTQRVKNWLYSRVITSVMMKGLRPERVRIPERV